MRRVVLVLHAVIALVIGAAAPASATPTLPVCEVPGCVVLQRSARTSVEYITCSSRSLIRYIDSVNGTDDAVVGWIAQTSCEYVGSVPGTTVVGLSIDGDVYACEALELHLLDYVGNCDEFGSNWTNDVGSNTLVLTPVNGFNDVCRQCRPAVIEVEALHTITYPPGFVPVAYGSGCFPSAANPGSSTQCQSSDVGVHQ